MTGPIAPRLQGRELTASRGTNETRPDGGAVSPRIPRRRLAYPRGRQSKTKSGGPSTRLGDRPSRWFLGDAVSHSSRAASLPLAGHPASFGLSLLRAYQGIARRGTASFGARIPEGSPPRGRRVDSCCLVRVVREIERAPFTAEQRGRYCIPRGKEGSPFRGKVISGLREGPGGRIHAPGTSSSRTRV